MNEFLIVSGSHKANSASGLVAEKVRALIKEHLKDSASEILTIANIPFWDEGMWGAEALKSNWDEWKTISKRLIDCDGLVVISPEYGGMIPPKLTNFLLLCSGKEIGHKPALPISVSASRGGAYPISQLRSYGYKNNHVCWLPDHVILRNVDREGDVIRKDSFEEKYAIYCLKLLETYSIALKQVREAGVIDHDKYPYGM